MSLPSTSRREFFKVSGALVVSFSFVSCETGDPEISKELPGSLSTNPNLDAWLRIQSDGRVRIFTGKAELGQGIKTALLQIAAEELDVRLDQMDIVSADTAITPDEGYTAGSMSIQRSGIAIRSAAAEARSILLEIAASHLGLLSSELNVKEGLISGVGNAQSVSYGDLIGPKTLHRRVTGTAKPKSPDQYRLVGKSVHRRDIAQKVFAETTFIQDLKLDGMLHARVLRPPIYGAQLLSVNDTLVSEMPGFISLVRDGSFLAVVSRREDQAIAAVDVLRANCKWTSGIKLPDSTTLAQSLRQASSDSSVVSTSGSNLREVASHSVEADYFKPFIAHASVGPSCALAHYSSSQMKVWTHAQGVFPLRSALSTVLELPEEKIRVIHMDGSGCYGHNGADDVACDAALIARALPERAIRVQWMRGDEFAWEPLGSAMSIHTKGSMDKDGNIVEWHHDLWSFPHSTRPGRRRSTLLAAWHLASSEASPIARNIPLSSGGADRNAVPLYSFPNHVITKHFIHEMPVRVSALRSLGAYANVFAIESFIDELAQAGNIDPLEIRLRHLKDYRAREVLLAATETAGVKPAVPGCGRGLGFARYKNQGAYIAVVADVIVDRTTGDVRVMQAFAAVDVGQVVNPDGLRNQIEGGMLQSTSWTLKEEMQIESDSILSTDWSSYPILNFEEAPKLQVTVLERQEELPVGAGEAAQGPTAAAIANAIFYATGVRFRTLPVTPKRVLHALSRL